MGAVLVAAAAVLVRAAVRLLVAAVLAPNQVHLASPTPCKLRWVTSEETHSIAKATVVVAVVAVDRAVATEVVAVAVAEGVAADRRPLPLTLLEVATTRLQATL